MLVLARALETCCCWGARSFRSLAQNAQKPLSPDCTTAPLPPRVLSHGSEVRLEPCVPVGSLCLLPTSPWSSSSRGGCIHTLSRFQPPGRCWVVGRDLDVPFKPGLGVIPAIPGLRPWLLPVRCPGPGRQSPQRVNRKAGRASSQGNDPHLCNCSRTLLNCLENASLGPQTCRFIGHQGSGLGGREGEDWARSPSTLLLPSAPCPGLTLGGGVGRAASRAGSLHMAVSLETAAGWSPCRL